MSSFVTGRKIELPRREPGGAEAVGDSRERPALKQKDRVVLERYVPLNEQLILQASVLRWFAYDHLPEHLQEVSKPFGDVAFWLVETWPRSAPERDEALRKLLEAKDAAVRNALEADMTTGQWLVVMRDRELRKVALEEAVNESTASSPGSDE